MGTVTVLQVKRAEHSPNPNDFWHSSVDPLLFDVDEAIAKIERETGLCFGLHERCIVTRVMVDLAIDHRRHNNKRW